MILGVTESTAWNWESNTSTPGLQYIPVIIRFLGYDPLSEPDGLGDRLIWNRTRLGLSQKQAAKQLGIDPGTLVRWESGENEPTGPLLDRVERFLNNEVWGAELLRVG